MSGTPNPPQVAELRQCLELVRQFGEQADQERKVIADAQARLEIVERSWRNNRERAVKLLSLMDCGPDANNGSEGRQIRLLTMLVAPRE